MQDVTATITLILDETSVETKILIARVFEIEKAKLYIGNPTDVDKEIIAAIKEIIR